MFSLLGAILFIALLPVLSVLMASAIATIGNCEVNEAYVTPCNIAGMDFGGLAYSLGVMGWLGLATLPLGATGVAIWIVAALIRVFAQRKDN